jgi:hypothetical protein
VEGREEEYNVWYNDVHLQEVTAVPGFVSAQRFKLCTTVGGQFKQDYVCIYEMEAESQTAAEHDIQRLMSTELTLSNAADTRSLLAGVFEACSPQVISAECGAPV